MKLLRERMPSTRILLMGILPRHKMNFRGRLDWPMFYTEVGCLHTPRASSLRCTCLHAAM